VKRRKEGKQSPRERQRPERRRTAGGELSGNKTILEEQVRTEGSWQRTGQDTGLEGQKRAPANCWVPRRRLREKKMRSLWAEQQVERKGKEKMKLHFPHKGKVRGDRKKKNRIILANGVHLNVS